MKEDKFWKKKIVEIMINLILYYAILYYVIEKTNLEEKTKEQVRNLINIVLINPFVSPIVEFLFELDKKRFTKQRKMTVKELPKNFYSPISDNQVDKIDLKFEELLLSHDPKEFIEGDLEIEPEPNDPDLELELSEPNEPEKEEEVSEETKNE